MIRKLLLPAIAAALLSGCVTYGYRDGRGDYYYGQPNTEYRYYDRYGYPGYGYSGYGYYGYPGYYGYSGGYYGYGAPYWGGYYRYYIPTRPRYEGGHHHGGGGSDGGQAPPPDQDRPERPRAPWRDLDGIAGPSAGSKRQGEMLQQAPRVAPRVATQTQPAPRMAPRVMPQRATAPVRATPLAPRLGNTKRDRRLNPVP
jgi:hypothetical protein